MPAPGALAVGRSVTSATTSSVLNLIPRGCQLLGFWSNASTAVDIFDEGTSPAGAAGDRQAHITASAVGWNPLPIDLINGLSINQGAQCWYVVV